MRVLIADDSVAVRERLVRLIHELGDCELRTAGRGAEALELAQSFEPHVMVLDLHMPGGSGLEVLRQVKARERPPLVIVWTSDPSDLHRRWCMQNCADFFFDKARDLERMLDVLGDVLRAHAGAPSA